MSDGRELMVLTRIVMLCFPIAPLGDTRGITTPAPGPIYPLFDCSVLVDKCQREKRRKKKREGVNERK